MRWRVESEKLLDSKIFVKKYFSSCGLEKTQVALE